MMSGLRAEMDWELGVLDLGAGVGRAQRLIAACAHDVALVVTPDPASIADAYAVIKTTLADGGSCPSVIVNQAVDQAEASRVHATLAAAADRFLGRAPSLLGWMPRSDSAARVVRMQRGILDVAPHGVLADRFHDLARAIRAMR